MGTDDGLVSTACLVLGVAGVAGLVAGALSMAAGEYVPVHSQEDTENADLKLERAELASYGAAEHDELAAIYVARGLDPVLATQVSIQLMAHDAIGAHARDELGISDTLKARPLQAALASAASFAVGAAMPLCVAVFVPVSLLILVVPGMSLLFLGALAAQAGSAPMALGAIRVAFWGALAMAVTAGAAALFGAVV